MGLHLPPDATLNTVPVADIQQTLLTQGTLTLGGAPRTSPTQKAMTTTLDTSRWDPERQADKHAQAQALLDTGFATRDPKTPSLIYMTEEGEALKHAVLRDRVPLEKADAVFETLKGRVKALNEEGINGVDEVWIYGSYMRRDQAVGDIDVAITTKDVLPIQDRAQAIKEKHGQADWYKAAQQKNNGTVTGQDYDAAMLFGHKQHPLLEDGQTTLFTLTSMPVPCQRVYTRENGWQAEPPLDKHPQARDIDPPGRKPKVSITIDQGTFSNANANHRPPSREDTIKSKTRAAARSHTPTQPIPARGRNSGNDQR